jgi:hypothetical protein
VVSAPAFAQLTIDGYYRVGGADNIDANGNAQMALMDRIRLNLGYAAPDDMIGLKARFQADSTTQSGLLNLLADTTSSTALPGTGSKTVYAPFASLKYGEGYAKFLDGAVKFTAGRLDVTDYVVTNQSTGNIYGGNIATDELYTKQSLLALQVGKTTGGLLQIFPVEGLSAALLYQMDNKNVGWHNLGLEAYYMIPDMGKFLLSSSLLNDTNLSQAFVSAGFSYTGVPGLTATAVYRYYSPSASTNEGTTITATNQPDQASGAVVILDYSSGPFFANVAGDFDFTNQHSYIEGEVAYQIIPQIKIRAYGGVADSRYTISGNNPDAFFTYSTTAVGTPEAGTALANVLNNYYYGVDVVFPFAKGSEVMVGAAYGDMVNWQCPILVKVAF